MPPKRKEEKEAVVYPASKRKAAPFKPMRPSKAPRTDSTGSEQSSIPHNRLPTGTTSRTITINDKDDADANKEDDLLSDSDTLEDLPPPRPVPKAKPSGFTTAKATHASASSSKPVASKPGLVKRKPPRAPTPFSDSSDDLPAPTTRPAPSAAPTTHAPSRAPVPSQSDEIPTVPQPLLVRLLYENFADKSTQIDKHALQVLQKYMEVFIRESIARAKQAKEEAVDAGQAKSEDRGWLESEDLEKVAPGMMVDF